MRTLIGFAGLTGLAGFYAIDKHVSWGTFGAVLAMVILVLVFASLLLNGYVNTIDSIAIALTRHARYIQRMHENGRRKINQQWAELE